MDIQDKIRALHQERAQAWEKERIVRDAAFIHSVRVPLPEDIAGFPAGPLTMFHCNLLRLMDSPLMPPFETPNPDQLAAFLWVVNPGFVPGRSRAARRARRRFLKTCRAFLQPGSPIFETRRAVRRWRAQTSLALAAYTRTVVAAREYVRESMQDKSAASGGVINQPDYYSDFCWIAARLMRHYSGIAYGEIQQMPLKVIYQFLKEIQEYEAQLAGQPAMLSNDSDRFTDEVLALLNRN